MPEIQKIIPMDQANVQESLAIQLIHISLSYIDYY